MRGGLHSAAARRKSQGKFEYPIRKRSHSRAAPRPSLIAQTTRLWPRRQSPAAKTPATLVVELAVLRLSDLCADHARRRAASSTAVLRTQESPWQEDEIAPADFSVPGTRSERTCLLVRATRPAPVCSLLDVAVRHRRRTSWRWSVDARVGAESRRSFLLAVIELVNFRPFRPGIVGVARSAAVSAGFRIAARLLQP